MHHGQKPQLEKSLKPFNTWRDWAAVAAILANVLNIILVHLRDQKSNFLDWFSLVFSIAVIMLWLILWRQMLDTSA